MFLDKEFELDILIEDIKEIFPNLSIKKEAKTGIVLKNDRTRILYCLLTILSNFY